MGCLFSCQNEKNDQIREGHISVIARSGKLTCLVSVTERLVSLLPGPRNPRCSLIRRIVKSKVGEHFHESTGISYSTILLEFKNLLVLLLIMFPFS